MKKSIVFLSLFLYTSVHLFAQIIFEENYGNAPNLEKTNSIIQHDDAVVLSGYTTLQTNGGDDLLLVKLDTAGDLIWKKKIGGSKNEQANKIRLLSDGYLIAGHTKSIGNGNQDFYLIKTDFDGNLIWERSYGTSNLEQCVDLIITADNGFMLLGTAVTSIANGEDWWVIKTDNDGNEEWSNFYGSEERDTPTIIKSLSDGNYLISGRFGYDTKILKIDINGTTIWDYTGSSGFSGANDILELNNNDLLVAQYPCTVKRLTSEGEEIYSQNHIPLLGLASFSQAFKIQPITEDSILILNQIFSFAINPENGDTLARLNWEYTDNIQSYWNDLLITDDQYFIAANHFILIHEVNKHNGILMKSFNNDRVQVASHVDTFELNTFKEYTEKIIETVTGDFLLFGHRESLYNNTDKILLTHTTADGALISEMTFDKDYQAKPVDILYSDLGNVILLTQINADTMELSMVNTDGLVLWTQFFSGSFDSDSPGKSGILKKYYDQYLLVLNDKWFHIFDETGNINVTYESNLFTSEFFVDITVLPGGRFLCATGKTMILLEEDASWISTTLMIPIGYSNVDFFGYTFKSEEEIWLTGTTKILGTDSLQFVIMKTNLDGERLLESVFGGVLDSELSDLNLLDINGDRLLVHGNKEAPWEYEVYSYGYSATQVNCLTKPLHSGFLEEWTTEGDVLHRLEFGVDKGANILDMIITTDGNFAGVGWIYDTNSDDQYLVKIDQGFFIPTTELDFNNQGTSMIYPNPGNTTIHFSLESEDIGRLQINIFDARGQLVYTQQADKTSSKIEIELDSNPLPTGIYFLQSMIDGVPLSIDRWVKGQMN